MTRMLRNLPRLLAGVLILLLGIAQPALAEVFCVNSVASLQTALTTAAGNGVDDEVRIVQGTYVGNFVYASTQANKLSVLGGYTAGCAGRTLDPANTILDGNQVNRVLVFSAPDVAAELLVEGLTLRKGKRGGGGTLSSLGGGLYAQVGDLGAVTVNRNRIENNTGPIGGAYIEADTVTITNNIIADNPGGGGMYRATIVTLTNNSITGNTAYDAGSSGTYQGGASIMATTVTLTNNSISGNMGNGAFIYAKYGTAALTNNSISGNTTANEGGGAYLEADTVTLTNNSITGNTASGSGGGAEIFATTATLTNNTLLGNTGLDGGGLYLVTGTTETTDKATLYNNLFWANRATDTGAAADLWSENNRDGDYLPTPVTLLANNFDQSAAGFKSTLPITIPASNLNMLNPLFVDQANSDLHLTPASPMIDAGYPGTPDLPEFDIEGTPRVLGNSVDIGAYEFDDGSEPKAILTLTLAGDASGSVTSSPTGINCGSDCFQAYDIDTLVTLTATPTDANSAFAGWSGDADCADGQVTMTTHLSCIATFMAQRWLTVTRAGQGKGRITSVPAGIDCGIACQAPFAMGTAVKLTATPDAFSTFAGWSGAGCPNPKLNLNRSCRATFNLKRFWLYTFVVGTGSGQVTSNPAGIRCGTDCEQEYVANTLVTLRAVPNARSSFSGWAGPCTGTAPTCKVRMSQVRGVAAIFDLKN